MAFIDTRLSSDIERGAESAPMFNTAVFQFANGYEARNANRSQDRREFDIAYGIINVLQLEAVIAAFHACNGRLNSFRFKDWADFEIGSSATPQLIGTGDASATTFQANKLYEFGSASYTKTVTKLVAGSVTVFIDTTGTGASYAIDGTASVNLATGIVTPTATPGSGHLVGLVAEYDIHVRFATDRLDMRSAVVNQDGTVTELPSIGLIEVLSP